MKKAKAVGLVKTSVKTSMDEIHLTKKDFRLEWFSGTGAGGQHRNKHQNCCRITHVESGLSRVGTASRSRVENKTDAFTALAPLVIAYYRGGGPNRREATPAIRTYHETRNEVHDKASGERRTYKGVVFGSDLGDLIDARAMSMRQRESVGGA